jgi:hypothetical protein
MLIHTFIYLYIITMLSISVGIYLYRIDPRYREIVIILYIIAVVGLPMFIDI